VNRGLLCAPRESGEMRVPRMRTKECRGDAAPPISEWTLFHAGSVPSLRAAMADLAREGNLHPSVPGTRSYAGLRSDP
jgi:hypothetical protein